jgi:hypothetical protein
VAVVREPGTYHGYLNEFDKPAAPRTVARMSDWITANALRTATHPEDVVSPAA